MLLIFFSKFVQHMSLFMAHRDICSRVGRRSLSGQSGNGAIINPMRRIPPPWTIDEANDACFSVRDSTEQALKLPGLVRGK